MEMKSLLILALVLIVIVYGQNPNTAISGAKDYYATFNQNTLGTCISNPEIYDTMGESFTIELWFRKNTGDGEYRNLVGRMLSQTPGTLRDPPNGVAEVQLGVQWNGAINFFTGCGAPYHYGYYIDVYQPTIYPTGRFYNVIPGRWTHVAVSVDWKENTLGIATGVAKLYIDGKLADASYWAEKDPYCFGKKRFRTKGEPFRLGYYDNQDPGAQIWIGDMDEIRIWNVSRTGEEIQKYMDGGLPPNPEGLISYHTFSEGSGFVSYNTIGTTGFPKVVFQQPYPSNWQFFQESDLKLTPNPAVTCTGYAASSQFYSRGGGDIWITKIVQNTDAKFLWSDRRRPTPSNIRRRILPSDLPLNIGDNFVEYSAGNVIGIDTIFYEARNNGSYPEPSGPARIYFETRCCGDIKADSCRVCGGNGSDCSVSCDNKGGSKDVCGVCNGDSQSCIGCDNKLFSCAKYDVCGVCGGNGTKCPVFCNGTVDQCGVCNGNNSCCLFYRGFPVQRMDHILLQHTTNSTIAELEALRSIIVQISQFIGKYATLDLEAEDKDDYKPTTKPSYGYESDYQSNSNSYSDSYSENDYASSAYENYVSQESPYNENSDTYTYDPSEYKRSIQYSHTDPSLKSPRNYKPHHHHSSSYHASHKKASQLPYALSSLIATLNQFCSSTDEYIAVLESFLTQYGQEIRVPYPPFNFPFTISD